MKTQLTLPGYYPASYNIHILGLCLTVMTACSVFKEKSFLLADSLQKQNIRRELKTESQARLDAVRIYNRQDSSDEYTLTEIFPAGPFKYSLEDGFSGNAHRVLINGHLKEVKKIRESAQFKQTERSVLETGATVRLSAKTRLKQKAGHSSNYVWYLAVLLLILATVFWFRRRLNA